MLEYLFGAEDEQKQTISAADEQNASRAGEPLRRASSSDAIGKHAASIDEIAEAIFQQAARPDDGRLGEGEFREVVKSMV